MEMEIVIFLELISLSVTPLLLKGFGQSCPGLFLANQPLVG